MKRHLKKKETKNTSHDLDMIMEIHRNNGEGMDIRVIKPHLRLMSP